MPPLFKLRTRLRTAWAALTSNHTITIWSQDVHNKHSIGHGFIGLDLIMVHDIALVRQSLATRLAQQMAVNSLIDEVGGDK